MFEASRRVGSRVVRSTQKASGDDLAASTKRMTPVIERFQRDCFVVPLLAMTSNSLRAKRSNPGGHGRDTGLPCRLPRRGRVWPSVAEGKHDGSEEKRRGVFLGVGLVSLVLTGPISALAQSSSTATTGQQATTDQQGQQMHRHSHHHAHQGGK